MIASSAMRMVLYIQTYHLTFLRILVLWGLLLLIVLFAGVIANLYQKNFSLFRYSVVVVTVCYLALSFAHPDYWIAKVNVEGSKETRSEFFKGDAYDDYYFLTTLSTDAAPVLLEWVESEGYDLNYYNIHNDKVNSNEYEGIKGYLYLRRLDERVGDIGVRKFNVSRYMADYYVQSRVNEGK
jgi:hypothetical protein